MNYARYAKRLARLQQKYWKMTYKQRCTWYGQWIAWRLQSLTAKMREMDRAVGRSTKDVWNPTKMP